MAGYHAAQTIFSINGTDIAGLTGITGLDLSADVIDTSAHDSTNKFREKVQGFRDAGDISLEGNYLSDNSQMTLYTLFKSGASASITITFPASLGSWSCTGFVSALSTDAPYDDKLGFSCTVTVSGEPTLTQGAVSI